MPRLVSRQVHYVLCNYIVNTIFRLFNIDFEVATFPRRPFYCLGQLCAWDAVLQQEENERQSFVAGVAVHVRNLLLEHARRARIVPMERMGEIETLRIVSDEPEPERRISARQELERLQALITALSPQCRQAFELQKLPGSPLVLLP